MDKKQFRQHQDDWRQALISHKKESGRALEGTTIRVALALQHYEHAAEDEDQCCAFPTRLSLTTRLGLDGDPKHKRRTITKHLTALEQAGFIVKVREGIRPTYEHPKGQSAKWILTIPNADKGRLATMWDEPVSADGVGGQSEQVGGSTEHSRGVNCAPKEFSLPTKGAQLAHPTTPDYQPQTDQPLTHTREASEVEINSFFETKDIEEFKKAYPKSAPTYLLKPAYQEAISQGATPTLLLHAAIAYAIECEETHQDVRYRTFPTKFLTDETWRDYASEERPLTRAQKEEQRRYWWEQQEEDRPF